MKTKKNSHCFPRMESNRFWRSQTRTTLLALAPRRRRLALVALAALTCASVAPAAWAASAITYVQGNYAAPQSSQTTVSVTFPAAQVGGDLNVVVVGWNDSTASVSSVTDSSGNTYQSAVGPTVVSGLLSQSIYYAKNIVQAAAGVNIVTVQFATTAGFPDIRILEYSGADPANPVDVSAAASGNGTTSSSGAAQTNHATDLLFGANTVRTHTSGPGSGFTARLLTSPDGDIAEDQMVTTTGSYSVTAPLSQGSWVMQMVAFRTAGAPDTQAPTAPTGLTATPTSSTQITLTWTASTDNVGVTAYLIERCQGSGCTTFGQIGTSAGTTFSDTGLTTSTSYSYRVRATDAAGNLSTYSSSAMATTLASIPGLVAAYSFDEGAGTTVTDLSGNGNTGTLSNTLWTNSGKYGNALVFNGTSSRVTINDAPSLHLTGAMTLEAWVNPSTIPNLWGDVIYKGNDNYFLEATSDHGSVPGAGAIAGSTHATVVGTTPLSVNAWTHLALTYDGTALRLYVNGTQVSTQAMSGDLSTSTMPLQIGGDSIFGQYFAGMIDEVRVYNVALNQVQIQADMAAPVGTAGSGPIVSLSAAGLSFGSVATGSSASGATTLSNVGGAQLSISSIAISGANASDFAQSNNCGASLGPSASCTINVTFAPTTTGTRSASVTITDNAPGSPHIVSLSGVGTGFAVTPRVAVLTFTQPQQFSANGGVTWSVDGVVGGSPSAGTITSTGLYTPPNTVGTHTVTATGAQTANAIVYVTNYPGTFTFHNDNLRSGVNGSETVLTPALVNPAQFGKLFSYAIDGWAFASPLYVANVNIPNQGLHNVVYVATEHDSVYAFDADGRSAEPLWQVSFLGQGMTTVPCADTGECGDIPNEIGITSTPVIDPGTGTLYVVAKTKEGGSTYVQRLHALDIATGAEKFGGPVVVQASVPGTGAGSVGNTLAFDPLRANQRPALLLSGGVVYLAFGSHGDHAPWHGWVIGYNATTLQRTMAWCVSPNGYGGGIWQSGSGPASDASGGIFFTTGNGDFNANSNGTDFGDAIVKLSSAGSILDYFAPYDQAAMEQYDLDLSSGGPALLIDQPGTTPHRLVAAGKTGTIYVVNRDNMGHFQSGSDSQIIQSLPGVLPHGTQEEGNYSAPVFFNNNVYFGAVSDTLKVFQFTNGVLSSAPESQSAVTYPNRGASFAVSANGSSNGLLWAVQDNTPAGGTLRVYDASDLSRELYNSDATGSRDTLGSATKLSIPLIANGKAFVVTPTQITAYGLLPW